MRAVSADIDGGLSVGEALTRVGGPQWRALGAAWRLAESSGAPLAEVLERMATAFEDVRSVARRRAALVAGPQSTATLVGWLPLAAIAIGLVFGFNPLHIFFTPTGFALLAAGLLLEALGMWWARRLITTVAGADRVAGFECEFVWIALAGGAPPREALRQVADEVSRSGVEWIQYASLRRDGAVAHALATAGAAGIPAAGLLLEAAGELRTDTRSQLEVAAERLGIRILVPLACCVLPAFVTLGVVPVVMTLLGGFLPL